MSSAADGMGEPAIEPGDEPFVKLGGEHVDTSSSIKVPLTAINWRPEYLERLEQLVLRVHYLKTHTYQLCKWIFVFEPERNRHFDHGRFLEPMFFYYVFMGLVNFAYPETPTITADLAEDVGSNDVDFEDIPVTYPPVNVGPGKPTTTDFKNLVAGHIHDYCASAKFESGKSSEPGKPSKYAIFSRIASYAKNEIATAYKASVKQRYGERLRYAINSALNTKQRAEQIRADMDGQGEKYIRDCIEREILAPARDVKDAINSRDPICYKLDDDGKPNVDKWGRPIVDAQKQRVIAGLSPVLDTYSGVNKFKKDSIYYDIKASPEKHLSAFSKLCKLMESRNSGVRKKKGRNKKANSIQCFPLRTSFIPCHMLLDPTIIRQHIINPKGAKGAKGAKVITGSSTMREIWSRVCSRKSKPFHPRRDLHFSGSADTDGVSISLKFNTTAVKEKKLKSAAKGAATKKAANAVAKAAAGSVVATGHGPIYAAVAAVDADSSGDGDGDGYEDIVDDDDDGVAAADDGVVGNFVVCNGSVPTDVEIESMAIAADVAADIGSGGAAATRVIRAARGSGAKKKWPKKESNADCLYVYRLPRKYLADNRKRLVYDDMGRGDIHSFMHHLSTRRHRRIMRYSRKQRGKETRMWRFRKICEKVKKAFLIDAISKAEAWLARFDRASLVPAKYKAYVEVHAAVWSLLSGVYSKTPTKHSESNHPIHKDKKHTAHSYPLHRKLQLSAYINQQQTDYRLARNMRTVFGKDSIIVVGNWSASMTKYHEPIRGKSWRDRFKRFGFTVYLINEFRTSCVCPECDKPLETFKTVRNPRPFRRKSNPTVTCNGLLRCTNQECLWTVDKYNGSSEQRLFNRNEAAVMNFRRIVNSLCETGDIPEALKRSTPRTTGAAAGVSMAAAGASSMTLRSASKRVATTGRRVPTKRLRNGVA
ncbi:hypothetical protein GGI17_000698 [Coemansia sp. S146]|nr:hypothetical protein GGI17_000698 [Coemansia sp. S146]